MAAPKAKLILGDDRMRFAAVLGVALLALSACATSTEEPGIAPAACYDRDFNVYFDGQSTDISPEARAVIDAQGQSLRGCYIESVRVIGAADAEAGAVTNEEVSERRAVVLGDYLAQNVGWPRSRMVVAALGERGAVTEEGLNVPMRRRARIIVDVRE